MAEDIQRIYINNLEGLWCSSIKKSFEKGRQFIEGVDEVPKEVYECLINDDKAIIDGRKMNIIEVEEVIKAKKGNRKRIISELKLDNKVREILGIEDKVEDEDFKGKVVRRKKVAH